jgi:hypothetical protein
MFNTLTCLIALNKNLHTVQCTIFFNIMKEVQEHLAIAQRAVKSIAFLRAGAKDVFLTCN